MFLFGSITDFFFPPLCIHCRREGTWLCAAAERQLQTIPRLTNPLTIPGVDQVYCRGSYDQPLLAQIVTGIKYSGWTAYQAILPVVMRPLLDAIQLTDIIIPVPLHSRRQRWRGFNQSDLVAQALSELTDIPVQPLIQRRRSTHAQARLNEQQRFHNLKNAFHLASGVENVPQRGILVDDVITTGSTIRECASVLRQAGMEQIIAVALAKG